MTDASAARRSALDRLCIDTIRTLAMDAVERAQSGHPGAPMAQAPLAFVLWTRHLRHNPTNPSWPGRDRFVLSCGHASMLLYSLLYLTGYDVSLDDVIAFRQFGSKTPGHPEFGLTPGVETTTGPLGQGLGTAVGMALAAAHLAARYNRPNHELITQRVYVFASDGDMMEGLSHEAASLAGHLGLANLIVCYDDNRITIDGPTDLTYSDDVIARFQSYGWHVTEVEDGNDVEAIDRALAEAGHEMRRPTLIRVRTHIGFGSPNKQDSADAHGAPLGEDEVRLTKANLGWGAEDPFAVPDEALAEWRKCVARGAALEEDWTAARSRYAAAHPDEAAELARRLQGELPEGWDENLPRFTADSGAMATRKASGSVLNAVASRVPELLGGSADLGGSNNTLIKGADVLGPANLGGRNMYFGIREHAMAAVMNGMALHGGIRPYGGTFLVFSDYMRPSIRLASMMGLRVIYVFTHDSIGLGEDGPTHQPVEMLTSLRAIPGLVLIRPGDAAETAEAWRVALERGSGPVALVLTRQAVPALDRAVLAPATELSRGGYVIAEASGPPAAILLASGSELHVALDARHQLEAEGISTRVVSMPSMELFAAQPRRYQREVLPADVRIRVAVEAGHPMSWWRWVGDSGAVIGMDEFGRSAPAQQLFEHFGFTATNVVERVRHLAAG
ncbi:MAG: transketolase [Gemmatimonadota bacterium]|nr:transketolase [Gemmatimonadota bacterium]